MTTTHLVPDTFNPLPHGESNPDSRAGDYYVSCRREDGHVSLVSGPYVSHADALAMRRQVNDMAEKHDPKAVWYSWGTCRMPQGTGPQGVLQKHGYSLDLSRE
jgi:hypothetical protein